MEMVEAIERRGSNAAERALVKHLNYVYEHGTRPQKGSATS